MAGPYLDQATASPGAAIHYSGMTWPLAFRLLLFGDEECEIECVPPAENKAAVSVYCEVGWTCCHGAESVSVVVGAIVRRILQRCLTFPPFNKSVKTQKPDRPICTILAPPTEPNSTDCAQFLDILILSIAEPEKFNFC